MTNAMRISPAVLALFLVVADSHAQDPVRLREQFPANYQYHVSSRVELSGNVALPLEKGETKPKSMPITGNSAIEYDERILAVSAASAVEKTLRQVRRMDFQRKVGDRPQESTLRKEVRRLVILRLKNTEVPFSPDGPLTWGEIDLLRVDVFTPALVGLLPDGPVKPGDRWNAGSGAIEELTDMDKVDEGKLECRFEEVTILAGRKHARIALKGGVRGVTEDGPSRQEMDGSFYFDMESNHLSYLSFKGIHSLLDKDGKEQGRIEGRFVLTRQANTRRDDMADAALKGIALDPNADNTQLLYDNPDLGVKLLYPRRWRMSGVQGRQLTLDEPGGNGLLLTLDPIAKVPTAAQFQTESRQWLEKQKAKVLRIDAPTRLQGPPQELERFSLEVEMNNQKATMEYYLLRQTLGGATIAARLLPKDVAALQKEVEKIARSVTITGQQK